MIINMHKLKHIKIRNFLWINGNCIWYQLYLLNLLWIDESFSRHNYQNMESNISGIVTQFNEDIICINNNENGIGWAGKVLLVLKIRTYYHKVYLLQSQKLLQYYSIMHELRH